MGAHSAMGETESAYHYASRHLDIARETGDRMGQATAQVNLSELAKTLGYAEGVVPPGKVVESPESKEQTAGNLAKTVSCNNRQGLPT